MRGKVRENHFSIVAICSLCPFTVAIHRPRYRYRSTIGYRLAKIRCVQNNPRYVACIYASTYYVCCIKCRWQYYLVQHIAYIVRPCVNGADRPVPRYACMQSCDNLGFSCNPITDLTPIQGAQFWQSLQDVSVLARLTSSCKAPSGFIWGTKN